MKTITITSKTLFQGDVGILELPKDAEIPKEYKKLNTPVIAYGEATGHKHAFDKQEKVEIFINPKEDKGDDRGYDEMYILVKEPVTLHHDEHWAFYFSKPGLYKKWIQKEYNFEEEYKRVAD
jgi:hypothetical protein